MNSINELLKDKSLEEKNAILDEILLQKAKEIYTVESAKEVVKDYLLKEEVKDYLLKEEVKDYLLKEEVKDYLLKEEVPNDTDINRTLAIFYLDKIGVLNEFCKEVESEN